MSPKRAREQPEARAVSIADAGDGLADAEAREDVEPVVLQRMRQFEILDKLRTIAKKGRRVVFIGQIAVVLNSICIRVCDCLSAFLKGMKEDEVAPWLACSCVRQTGVGQRATLFSWSLRTKRDDRRWDRCGR